MSYKPDAHSSEYFTEPESEFRYHHDLFRLCCRYGREAISRERYCAAEGLFQTAIIFFEKAQQLAARIAEDSHLEDLKSMRDELNSCNRLVNRFDREAEFANLWKN